MNKPADESNFKPNQTLKQVFGNDSPAPAPLLPVANCLCGSTVAVQYSNRWGFEIRCNLCGKVGELGKNRFEAKTKWNAWIISQDTTHRRVPDVIMKLKEHLSVITDLIVLKPPVIHNRESYKHACKTGCKACEYLRVRDEALDAVLHAKQLIAQRNEW